MRRMVLAAVTVFGFAVPASIAVVAMAPAAQAASSGSCAKVKGSVAAGLVFSKCTPVPKADKQTYKALTATNIASLATGGTLTWSGGATVTFGLPTLVTPPTNPCKGPSKKLPQDTIEHAVGTVTTGDGVVSQTGDSFSITICISAKNGKIYFPPGANLTL